jgi:triacylglycerol lipase
MSSVSVQTLTRSRRRPSRSRADDLFIWREALWGLDWLSLRLSPVYKGIGVPRGDGEPVVLVPGFLTTDAYLVEMYFWLRRIGYTPYVSGIGLNAGCMDSLSEQLEKTVEKAHEETGKPVRLIGHSLGGFLARMVATRRPDIVSQLISLGSPIRALDAHPALMAAAGVIRRRPVHRSARKERPGSARDSGCGCRSDGAIPTPAPSVRRAALFSDRDGVIDWRNCQEDGPHPNHEVGGTHIGLVFNAKAYRVVAELLAGAAQDRDRLAA